MPITYSTELKVKTIRRYEKGESIKALSQELHISQSTLYQWRKEYCSIKTPNHTYTPAEFDAISRRLQKLEHHMEIIRQTEYLSNIPLQKTLYGWRLTNSFQIQTVLFWLLRVLSQVFPLSGNIQSLPTVDCILRAPSAFGSSSAYCRRWTRSRFEKRLRARRPSAQRTSVRCQCSLSRRRWSCRWLGTVGWPPDTPPCCGQSERWI